MIRINKDDNTYNFKYIQSKIKIKIHPLSINIFIYRSMAPSRFLLPTPCKRERKCKREPLDRLALFFICYSFGKHLHHNSWPFFLELSMKVKLNLSIAPERSKGLDGCCSEDVLVVECSNGSSNEGSNPEDPLTKEEHINIYSYIPF